MAHSPAADCKMALHPKKVEGGGARVVCGTISSQQQRVEEEMSNGGSTVQCDKASPENQTKMEHGPDKNVSIDQLKAKGLLTVLSVRPRLKEEKAPVVVSLIGSLTRQKALKPEAAGLNGTQFRRGNGAGVFKLTHAANSNHKSLLAAATSVEADKRAAVADVSIEEQKDMELGREWFSETRRAKDFDYQGHRMRIQSKRALAFASTNREGLRSCIAKYKTLPNVDSQTIAQMDMVVAESEAIYSRIEAKLNLARVELDDDNCVEWTDVHTVVMADAAELSELVCETRSFLGDFTDDFFPSIKLEPYLKDLSTPESVEDNLKKRLAVVLRSNKFYCKHSNSDGEILTMVDVYNHALSQTHDYFRALSDSVSKPIKSAKEGVKFVKSRVTSGEYTMDDLFAASGKAVMKLSEAAYALADFSEGTYAVPVNDLLSVLALQEKYDVTPDEIVESLESLIREIGKHEPSINKAVAVDYRPKYNPEAPYKCARCSSTDHRVEFCPLGSKCGKCKIAGLLCGGSSKKSQHTECDPLGLMAPIEHFFFLELAKLAVKSDDVTPLTNCCSTVILVTTPSRFADITRIMHRSIDDSKSGSAVALRFTETPAFKSGVASRKCAEFLNSYHSVVHEAKAAKEAAEQAAKEEKIAAQAARKAAAEAARSEAALAAATSRSAFDFMAIPDDVKTVILAQYAGESTDIAEESENVEASDDEGDDSGDEALAKFFGKPKPNNRSGEYNARQRRDWQLQKFCRYNEFDQCGGFRDDRKKGRGSGHRGRTSDNE